MFRSCVNGGPVGDDVREGVAVRANEDMSAKLSVMRPPKYTPNGYVGGSVHEAAEVHAKSK
jgi:hypothetical protein